MRHAGGEGDAGILPAGRARWRWVLAGAVVLWLAGAYFLLPMLWKRSEERHPALPDAPRLTRTSADIPGDPLNIAAITTRAGIIRAMIAAGWRPADPITLKTSLEIAASTVLRFPYPDAPVSNLYLWGRKEDLAFERPVGSDARKRHHVRFWCSEKRDGAGRPCWFGAATFDDRVGLSHTTGQITHHIAPDVDAERDGIVADLRRACAASTVAWLDGFHVQLEGRNGGGDPWRTDGRLAVVTLAENPDP